MKLALVTETFPPEVNGVSMTLGRLVTGLEKIGFRSLVVRPEQTGESSSKSEGSGLHCELVVPGAPLPGYRGLRMGTPAVGRILHAWREDRPDIVHVATEGPLGLVALLLARSLGLPTSSTFHTNFHQYSSHYRFGFVKSFALVYLRIFHNWCGCTLAPTEEMAQALERCGFRNMGVLSRGVDTTLFAPEKRSEKLRGDWGATPTDRVYLYVGRIAKEKNIDLAIVAYQALSRSDQGQPLLVVVGDGPELKRLREANPRVVFAGMRRGEDLAQHYASGDVFLFPSTTETFGNVVTEAMSSGLATITFDYAAGRQHILNGENGYLVPLGQSDAFVRSVLQVAEQSAESLSAVRRQARATALSISWDRIVETFRHSLSCVVKKHKRLYRIHI